MPGTFDTKLIKVMALALGLGGLSACASTPPPAPRATQSVPPASSFPADGEWQCVPYARYVSGVEIYGDAWTWWDQASDKFQRGQRPQWGAVMVFARTDKLRLGHLAVVTAIKGAREIMVTDANWGNDRPTRGFIHDEKAIRDVSPDNSWRQVRVWNSRAQDFGSVYEVKGFIYSPRQTAKRQCANGPGGPLVDCPVS